MKVLKNNGFVNVGISHDTSEFAVESIRQWWKQLGKKYPNRGKENKLFLRCEIHLTANGCLNITRLNGGHI